LVPLHLSSQPLLHLFSSPGEDCDSFWCLCTSLQPLLHLFSSPGEDRDSIWCSAPLSAASAASVRCCQL
jgi:hypothetical protein